MTLEEIDRLEAKARDLTGKPLATAIALTPGQVLELCRLARRGEEADKGEGHGDS
jgi:hypothetical protein